MTASAASVFDASAVAVAVVAVALKLLGKVETHCQIQMMPRMAKL